jgi:uncharacterized protein YxeA
MVVSSQLKKQIIIEILALLFLVGVIIYAVFAIHKGNQNKVTSINGMVVVVDDNGVKEMSKYSDGEGLELQGTKFNVTNNNEDSVTYEVVVVPNKKDEDLLNHVRISTDDLYVSTLTELPRNDEGYVLVKYTLNPGYTKVHLIKNWYMLSTSEDLLNKGLKLEFHLVRK